MLDAYYRRVDRMHSAFAAGYDALDLVLRLYLAQVFFRSGLVKIGDFETTRALFADEYRVPLLSPDLAAVLGTAGELVLPALLALGLLTRFAAAGLFVLNAVAVVAYWHVLKDLEPALAQHAYWGALLLVPLFAGNGRIALDHPLARATPNPRAA
jgi:putative oxidoreductase